MSEQATLIRSVPPIKKPDPKPELKVVEEVVSPKGEPTPDPILPEDSSEIASDKNLETPDVTTVIQEETSPLVESNDSITSLQGVTYGSFILACCLAGFASIIIFRKALKVSAKRFSFGAKMLSLAYLIIAFNSFFGVYLYSNFLNGDAELVPLAVPILSWILVGPLIAVILNSLLTREDIPGAKKMFFDAFTYFVIFGCVVASQIPSFSAKEQLLFSFFGAFFLIVPIVRFSTSLKIAKAYHPELKEIFVQILICCLLILPMLLPSLVLVNAYNVANDMLTILLFNAVTVVFVLMTGLLMIISIDYVTQGISIEQLAAQKSNNPNSIGSGSDASSVPPSALSAPVASSKSPEQAVYVSPHSTGETAESESQAYPTPPVATPSAGKKKLELNKTFEESSETLDFDVEKNDSTVIKFNVSHVSEDKSDETSAGSSNPDVKDRSPNAKSNLADNAKSSQSPKAPPSPDSTEPKASGSRIKPPEKPKKRL